MPDDFVGKLLPLIHMTPEDPRRRLRPEDVDSASPKKRSAILKLVTRKHLELELASITYYNYCH